MPLLFDKPPPPAYYWTDKRVEPQPTITGDRYPAWKFDMGNGDKMIILPNGQAILGHEEENGR